MGWDPTQDAWFSGFTAGEGCFVINRDKERALHQPHFILGLRIDDVAVLQELCDAFGGRIRYQRRDGASRPAAHWRITKKQDLRGLVEYFDRFPLRAKKARDYEVWRRAVLIFCAKSSSAEELVPLHEALQEARRYVPVDTAGLDTYPPPTAKPTQLRLVS